MHPFSNERTPRAPESFLRPPSRSPSTLIEDPPLKLQDDECGPPRRQSKALETRQQQLRPGRLPRRPFPEVTVPTWIWRPSRRLLRPLVLRPRLRKRHEDRNHCCTDEGGRRLVTITPPSEIPRKLKTRATARGSEPSGGKSGGDPVTAWSEGLRPGVDDPPLAYLSQISDCFSRKTAQG